MGALLPLEFRFDVRILGAQFWLDATSGFQGVVPIAARAPALCSFGELQQDGYSAFYFRAQHAECIRGAIGVGCVTAE